MILVQRTMIASRHKKAWPAAMILLALSACVGADDDMARFLVAPGKFDLYTCPDLMQQAAANSQRRLELERLIGKARQDAGGEFVGALVFRPEYLAAQGEWRDLREAAAAKKCSLAQFETAPAGPDNTAALKDALPALR